MTDNDDPFGRRDRTIIRPNPGGRRPTPPPNAPGPATPFGGAPPASAPLPPVSYPQPGPQIRPAAYQQPGPPPPPQPTPYSQVAPPPKTGQNPWDGWQAPTAQETNPYLNMGASSAPMTPAPQSPHVSVEMLTVASDPIMRGAASLLLLLGRLRSSLSRAVAGQLMDQVAQAIQRFENDARDGGATLEQVNSAKYALAATADDIVQNLPTVDHGVWTQYSMLVRFFSERTGGVRFFKELDRAKQSPVVNLGLLELMHACLSMGFEGVYRANGSPGELQNIRRELYELIRRNRPKTIEDLSPHWRGQTIALAGSRFQVPLWSAIAAALLILFIAYLFLRGLLSAQAEALRLKMSQVHPEAEVSIFREAPVPPPPPPKPSVSTQLERVRAALADEILAGKASTDQTPNRIIIRIGNVVLFPSGGANANASFGPIAKKIAQALDKEAGQIQIDGYTDTDPIKTIAFPSNFELSEARAKSVAAMLKSDLAHPERVQLAGHGETNPVAPNDVEANKSKNRRVEISIPRDDL